MSPDAIKYSNRFLLGFLIVVALLKLASLGAYPLMDTTESRYADVARIVVSSGDWITPRYPVHPDYPAGEPYMGKPPLSFWMTAVSFGIFGVSEFAARLPSFINGILIVLMTFFFVRKFCDERTAYFSAVILATTAIMHVMSGVVSTDISLTMAISLSLFSFYLALNAGSRLHSRLWGYAFFAGLGLSLLAKGPLGVVLTFIPIAMWVLFESFDRMPVKSLSRIASLAGPLADELKKIFFGIPWFTGTMLTIMIALPWYLLMERDNPGYLRYFIFDEHIYKYLKPKWKGDLYGNPHPQPIGTIWLFFLGDTMPWLIIFLASILAVWKKKMMNPVKLCGKPFLAFVLLWMLAPLLFFTLCKNIQMTYFLYGAPAFAILTAVAISAALREHENLKKPGIFRTLPLSITACTVPFVFTVVAFAYLPHLGTENCHKPIIDFIMKDDKGGNSEIIYIRNRVPFSASFYSKGRARNITGKKEEFQAMIKDPRSLYIVVREDNEYGKKLLLPPYGYEIVGKVEAYLVFKKP